MTATMERLRAIGTAAWLRFVQSLNWIAVSLCSSIVLVHQAYPGVITNELSQLPPWIGIPAIIGFGLLVHYALRRAKLTPNG